MSDPISSGDGDQNCAVEGIVEDEELKQFLLVERERAQLQAQVHNVSAFCWDMCTNKPLNKLDSRTETCVTNCVNRFIDTSLLITHRFAQMLQKNRKQI